MNDSDDDAAAVEPRRRGRLILLVAILLVVAGIGALGYIGVTLGSKALRLVGSFAVHTQRAKVSPDGTWRLVIDSHDEGALGGSTTVYLEPAGTQQHTFTLHEADWLPDGAVRWLDARTIVLDGRLEMPFIEHSVDTGSAATSGTAVDASGSVRDFVAPGERVVLLGGLSLVAPRGSATTLLTRRAAGGGRLRQELRPANGESWPGRLRCSILCVSDRGELPDPRVATAGSIVPASLGKQVEVRWDARSHWLIIHTRLRRRLLGLIWERDVSARSSAGAASRAEALWRLFQVERVPSG